MSMKIDFQKCMTRGYGAVAPKGRPQMPNLLRFWLFFVHSHFPHLHTIPVLSPLFFPTSPLFPFTPPLPFLKEVNKKLSYRGRNALSVIKTREANAIPTANIILYLPVRHAV